ncbi:DUF1307 domain-containing protein [Enterococcus sp. AZ101]|uniref:DUF1307 domain-containing protein n=1 Tax=Enterococcus sp. AZ101 TaxID=2774742 RepID=UPI003D2A498B
MKKDWRVIGIVFLLLVFMSACTAKSQTATYKLRQDDENVTIQNSYKNDTLLKQTITTIIQYETMGVKTKKKAESLLKPSKELYVDKKGLNYSIIFKEKEAVETIEVDLKLLSKDDAKMLPLISLPDGDFDSASEKANAEKLTNLGFEKED